MSQNLPSPGDLGDFSNDGIPSSNIGIEPGAILQQRYRIEEILAEGGMGRVYRAWDTKFSRRVALKQLILQMDSDNSEIAERFRREYYFLNAIDHRNLVKAHDLFTCEGQFFLALEFVTGISLKSLLQDRPFSLSLSDQIAVANQIARAVEVLNTAGILHRDIKPGNIMVNTDNGRVTLLDLGLGKVVGKEDWALTQKGAVIGTLEYLSPEQASGKVKAQSDVFALGISLYQFFLWEPYSPFRRSGGVATLMEITTKDLTPLAESVQQKWRKQNKDCTGTEQETYQALTKILNKVLQKEAEQRPTAGDIADELENLHRKLISGDTQHDKNLEQTNWNVTVRVDVEQAKQLKKLGEKYGRDRVSSRRMARRNSSRVSRASQNQKKIGGDQKILTAIVIVFIVLAGIWLYSLGQKNKKIDYLSRKLQEYEGKIRQYKHKTESLENQRKSEMEKLNKFREQLLHIIPYNSWGEFYKESAVSYQNLNLPEKAVKEYEKAIQYTSDRQRKKMYQKEIIKLEKKLSEK